MADSAGSPPTEPGAAAAAVGLLLDPRAVGESVVRRPFGGRTVAALVMLLGVAVACGIVLLPVSARDFRERMRDSLAGMSAADQARLEARMETPAMKAFTVASQAVLTLVAVVVIASLLWLAQLVMGGQATFAMALSLTAFGCLISLGVGQVLQTALALATGSYQNVSLGLGAFVDRPAADPLRAALDLVNFVVLPAAIGIGLALAPAARLGRGTTLTLSLLVYVLMMGVALLARVWFQA